MMIIEDEPWTNCDSLQSESVSMHLPKVVQLLEQGICSSVVLVN